MSRSESVCFNWNWNDSIDRIKFICSKGEEMLYLDLSGCKTDEVPAVIERAKAVIRTPWEQPLLTVTNAISTRFDEILSQRMKEFTLHTRPFVKAAAVVGVVVGKMLPDAIMLFSGRKFHAFEKKDQAEDWLASI